MSDEPPNSDRHDGIEGPSFPSIHGDQTDPRRAREVASDQNLSALARCRSCGRRHFTDNRWCRRCQLRYREHCPESEEDTARHWDYCHLVFAVVEGANVLRAIEHAVVAFDRLVDRSDDAIDSCHLVHDFEETPSTYLTDRWNGLSDVARTDTEPGTSLLEQAKDRAGWDGTEQTEGHTTYLYDADGQGIQTPTRLETVLYEATDRTWLVPAIGLTRLRPSEE